ncbi:MAG: hypothetical protein AMXMBFR61_16160 [Fimbriimonadales bacterium]
MVPLTLDEIVNRTSDLPSIPEAVLSVVRLAGDADATASKVAGKIAYDQSLTARVLRLANSAYYGLPRRITSLQEAVVMLGMKTVRHLALVASTFPWLTQPRKGYALAPRALWEHSIAVSIGAQLLAARSRKVSGEEAFSAGLLHDLGKVVLSMWMEARLADLVVRCEQEQTPFDQLEREEFGFDHCDVGAYLAQRWNLPEALEKAIQYHHAPGRCDPPELLVDCVHIADVLAMTLGYGLGGDGLCYTLNTGSMQRLGLEGEDYDWVLADMQPAVSKALDAYALK